MFNQSPDDYTVLKKKYGKVLTWLASTIGGNTSLLDRDGNCLLSVNPEGDEIVERRGRPLNLGAGLPQLDQPGVIESRQVKGASACVIPLGEYVLVASNHEAVKKDQKLLESLKKALPSIARVVGGEGVIFDEEGRRLVNVSPDGNFNHELDKKVSRYAMESMRDYGVVIGPSTSTHGAMAVRVPLSKSFGLGFNNELAVRQKRKLQEQINKDKTARYTFDDIIGESQAILNAKQLAEKVTQTNSTVLILGETGTGKELFAQAIHNASGRSNKPFVAINCGAIPPSLIESTLFGYSKGAFTGAIKEGQAGLFELAHGGTLFLDEISEMDYDMQAKLLRVLQENEVTRLGDKRAIPVDIRVISSTNKDLEQLAAENKFRQDLLFRLDVVRINIPPLRERKEDILKLAEYYIQKLNYLLGTYILGIEPKEVRALLNYNWPGNVRELRNCIERALNTAVGGEISLNDLPYRIQIGVVEPAADVVHSITAGEGNEDLNSIIARVEKEQIMRVLNIVKGDREKAANVLGISLVTLWRKIKKYHLDD